MGFLFRLGFLLLAAIFVWPKLFAPAPEHATHEGRQNSLAATRQAAEERIVAAARDRCLKAPQDCVEFLKAAATTDGPAPAARPRRRSEKAASPTTP